MENQEFIKTTIKMFEGERDYLKTKGYELMATRYQVGIDAMKKQILEEPYYSGDGYWNGEIVYDTWTCQNCGKSYEVEDEEYDYCPNCGQRIKWDN